MTKNVGGKTHHISVHTVVYSSKVALATNLQQHSTAICSMLGDRYVKLLQFNTPKSVIIYALRKRNCVRCASFVLKVSNYTISISFSLKATLPDAQ